jgi:hypothetical protein
MKGKLAEAFATAVQQKPAYTVSDGHEANIDLPGKLTMK